MAKNKNTVCPNCGKSLPESAVFCDECGTKIDDKPEPDNTAFCTQCGAPLPEDAAFCTNCGARVRPAEKPNSPKVSLRKEDAASPGVTSGGTAAGPTVSSAPPTAPPTPPTPPPQQPSQQQQRAADSTPPSSADYTGTQASVGAAARSKVPIYLWPLLITITAGIGLALIVCAVFDPSGFIASFFSLGSWIGLLALGAVTAVLYIIDIIYLSSIGIRGGWKWSVLIPVIYMFVRAAKTNRKYLIAIVYLVIWIAGIALEVAAPYIWMAQPNSYTEVSDDEIWAVEALPDGQPVTYEQLLQNGDGFFDSEFDGDIAIEGRVTAKTTEDSVGVPILLYTVAADGNPAQPVQVLCMEADPDPEPNVGDEVLCDGLYVGTGTGQPRIIGTVFLIDAQQAAAETPSAAATKAASTPTPAATPAGNFMLDRPEADYLADEVAGPLLFAEWYATCNAIEYYDDSVWTPARTVQITDIAGRRPLGAAPGDSSIWMDYIDELIRMINQKQGTAGSEDSLFGGGAYTVQTGLMNGTFMEERALANYFSDAFGRTDLMEVIASPSVANQLQVDGAGNWYLPGSDPGYFLTMNLPGSPLQVTDGKVSFTGYIVSDADWIAPLTITLDVVEDPASRYGCNVVSYTVTPADISVVPTEDLPMIEEPAPVVPAAPGPAGSFDADGFIFPDSSVRYLTEADIAGLSPEQLGFARNEIFARHGNLFRKDIYANHYTSYDWYNNLPNKHYDVGTEELNDVERANVSLISAREAQLG